MESNPYASPSANLYGTTAGGGADAVSEGAIRQLQGTKPWVQFMSVLFFIGAAFMFLAGILMGVMGGIGGMAMAGGEPGAGIAGAMGIVIAVFYCLFGVLYLLPAVKMWKYGSRIGTLAQTRSVADLEGALNEQRIVWKFWGILTIVGVVLVVGGSILAGVAGAMAGASGAGL